MCGCVSVVAQHTILCNVPRGVSAIDMSNHMMCSVVARVYGDAVYHDLRTFECVPTML